jgi:hypothetical protein
MAVTGSARFKSLLVADFARNLAIRALQDLTTN